MARDSAALIRVRKGLRLSQFSANEGLGYLEELGAVEFPSS